MFPAALLLALPGLDFSALSFALFDSLFDCWFMAGVIRMDGTRAEGLNESCLAGICFSMNRPMLFYDCSVCDVGVATAC
jgi:hypothetical protein